MDLFDNVVTREAPLAERMRPVGLGEVVGQSHLLAPGKVLREALASDQLPSMILWGPPGSGKTTLARVFATETQAVFESVSAVVSGIADLRKLVEEARVRRATYGRGTLLFVDEIHRFNKSQQDVLLPHVERGTVTLVGATTENPSFAINAALLSRATVFRLEPLSKEELLLTMRRALVDPERGFGGQVDASDAVLEAIASASQGDCRRALTVLETAVRHTRGESIELETVSEVLATRPLLYDRAGEEHYNVVSAFIKSLRGSDPDAAVYWMMRMVEAGEDPLFILRRMLIFASEDIGNADPRALELAVATDTAFRRLGLPEGLISMAQCCTYLAVAPKSNASYAAMKAARVDVRKRGALPVPMKLRNAPTSAMKDWGYGEGYRYPHDEGGFAVGETYLPEALSGRRYYHPTNAGFEVRIAARLDTLRRPSAVEPSVVEPSVVEPSVVEPSVVALSGATPRPRADESSTPAFDVARERAGRERDEGDSRALGDSDGQGRHTVAMRTQEKTICGTVRRLGLEGGLWALVSDEGTTYELLDPPAGLQQDGLRAEVDAATAVADVTVGMVGDAIEVRSFRLLEP